MTSVTFLVFDCPTCSLVKRRIPVKRDTRTSKYEVAIEARCSTIDGIYLQSIIILSMVGPSAVLIL